MDECRLRHAAVVLVWTIPVQVVVSVRSLSFDPFSTVVYPEKTLLKSRDIY
jgi:hypothetical protein